MTIKKFISELPVVLTTLACTLIVTIILAAAFGRWSELPVWLIGQGNGLVQVFGYISAPLIAGYGIYLLNRRTKALEDNVRISRQTQLDERFKAGAEMLGHDDFSQKTAGMTVLKNLAMNNGGKYANEVFHYLKGIIDLNSSVIHSLKNNIHELDKDNEHKVYDSDYELYKKNIIRQTTANINHVAFQMILDLADSFDETVLPNLPKRNWVIDFRRMELDNAFFTEGKASRFVLEYTRLNKASFAGVSISQCSFLKTLAQNSHFYDCIFNDNQIEFISENDEIQNKTTWINGAFIGGSLISDRYEMTATRVQFTGCKVQFERINGKECYFVGDRPTIHVRFGKILLAGLSFCPDLKKILNDQLNEAIRNAPKIVFDKDNPNGREPTEDELGTME